MSNFDINEEIDKIVEKSCATLTSRIKAIVERSQKQIIRQYIASQKDTAKTKPKTAKADSSNSKKTTKGVIKREADYDSDSDDSD